MPPPTRMIHCGLVTSAGDSLGGNFPDYSGYRPVTSGWAPTERVLMSDRVRARGLSAQPARWPFRAALTCGLTGLVANGLLVGFFAFDYPASGDGSGSWLGFANDVVGTVEFALFLPVIVAVGRVLPPRRSTTVVTVLALVATTGLVLVSLALVVGAMSFEVQVGYVMGFLVLLYGWLLVVSSVGHRVQALPRSVTRFGLLLGVSWPAALLLILAGLLLGGVDLGAFRFGLPGALLIVPALVLGLLNWLALPVWPLLLATSVLRPRSARSEARTHTVVDKGDVR